MRLVLFFVWLGMFAAVAQGGPSPAISKVGGRHLLQLPAKMARALRTHDPKFEIWNESDYDSQIVAWYSFSRKEAPFAIVGDFNADGVLDAAVQGHAPSYGAIKCILSEGSGAFRVLDVKRYSPSESPKLETFLGLVPRGPHKDMWDIVHRFPADAILVEYWEKASEAFWLRGATFVEVQMSD